MIDINKRTSDSGNGNDSVSLSKILRIKVGEMLPSSYISSLLVFTL